MIILLVSIAGLLVIFCVIFLVLYVETKKDLSHVKKAISRIVPEKNSPLHILLEKLQGAFEDKIKTIQIQESRNNEILDFRKRLSGTFTINKLVESLRNGINAIQGLDSAYLLLLFPERQLVKLWGVFPETNYLQEEIP